MRLLPLLHRAAPAPAGEATSDGHPRPPATPAASAPARRPARRPLSYSVNRAAVAGTAPPLLPPAASPPARRWHTRSTPASPLPPPQRQPTPIARSPRSVGSPSPRQIDA